jgi:quinolinate synthase
MAETAKILNPTKTVLLPTEKGGCSLAESITAADVRALRAAYPGVPIVTYINTYADVKAECDICCTSSNAAAVVESLKSDTVIFLPDEYLARNVARETGRHVIVPSVLRKAGAGSWQRPTVEHTMVAWKAAAKCTNCSPRGHRRGAPAVPRRHDPRAP